MRRRRSLPWIHRWSRPIIGAISIAGALLTAYLTVNKMLGSEVACSADAAGSGCGGVLDSAYATVFNLPLSLFGCLAYLSMAAFALVPLAVSRDRHKEFKRRLENNTWWLLLAGSTAMAVFSGYLMYVLATKLQAFCPYCIGSALFALSLLILTIAGREWEDIGQILFTGIIVAMLTLVGTLGVYANVDRPVDANGQPIVEQPDADGLIRIQPVNGDPQPPYGWQITSTSGEAEISLAEHLTAIDAKKYGAFWCPHCYDQKQLFGKEAFAKINYIECDLEGENPQRDACIAAGIQSFPTWEINGKLAPGVKTAADLAKLSGYQGNTDFKYKL